MRSNKPMARGERDRFGSFFSAHFESTGFENKIFVHSSHIFDEERKSEREENLITFVSLN